MSEIKKCLKADHSCNYSQYYKTGLCRNCPIFEAEAEKQQISKYRLELNLLEADKVKEIKSINIKRRK